MDPAAQRAIFAVLTRRDLSTQARLLYALMALAPTDLDNDGLRQQAGIVSRSTLWRQLKELDRAGLLRLTRQHVGHHTDYGAVVAGDDGA